MTVDLTIADGVAEIVLNDPGKLNALDDKIDVVVGVNRAEALIDADQFDGGSRWRRHRLVPPTRRPPNIDRRQPNGDDRA